MEGLLYSIVIGGLAGWFAGQIKRGFGFGLIGNIILGIVGAVVGSWLFGVLGISLGPDVIDYPIKAVIGALVVLVIVGLIKRA